MDFVEILNFLTPGAEYVIRGNCYDGITWMDKTQKQPTEKECIKAWKTLKGLAYRDQRALQYPPIGDQLDALWKGGDAAAAMKALVQAVKDKNPKP